MPKWLALVLHVVVVAGSVAATVYGGVPAGMLVPVIAGSVANALIKSPLSPATKDEHLAAAEKATK